MVAVEKRAAVCERMLVAVGETVLRAPKSERGDDGIMGDSA